MAEPSQQKLIFGVGNEINQNTWHQENIDTVIPILIILTGIFQFVLRKWLFPVSEDVISKLDNQLPTQGLLYKPGFGMFLIVVGVIMLLLNI